MKKFIVVFCLLLCTATLRAKDKPNPADFAIKVHISATHMRLLPGQALYADAILNGKKLELQGNPIGIQRSWALIIPGDYPARLTKDIHNADSTAIFQEYEILLPDGTVWPCVSSGVSE